MMPDICPAKLREAPPRRVVVTGLGLVSPLGVGVEDAWSALLAGRVGATPIRRFDACALSCQIACQVEGFRPEDWLDRKSIHRLEPFAQYAVAAARQAWEMAGLPPGRLAGERAGCVLGVCLSSLRTIEENYHQRFSPHLSPMIVPRLLGSSAPGKLSQEFGLLGPNLCLASPGCGGLEALGAAAAIIQRGQADLMLAGGAETPITPLVLAGLGAAGLLSANNQDPQGACRPFDAGRDGMVLGEGAAVLVLEALETASARGAAPLGEITGFASVQGGLDHEALPAALLGRGLAASLALALARAGLAPEEVDYVLASAAGLVQGDRAEAQALGQVFPGPRRPRVGGPKAQIGHWLGAAGAAEAVLALMAMRDQTLPPQVNLSRPEPGLGLDLLPPAAQAARPRQVMVAAAGLDGACSSLLLSLPGQPTG